MTPGADWALVIKHTVSKSLYDGFLTAWGIMVASAFPVFCSLMGIDLFALYLPFFYEPFRFLGGGYLAFIGLKALLLPMEERGDHVRGSSSGFQEGFFTHIVNPNVYLFYLSLFAFVTLPKAPIEMRLFYGVAAIFITGFWYSALAFFANALPLSRPWVQVLILRSMGLLLTGSSVALTFSHSSDLERLRELAGG